MTATGLRQATEMLRFALQENLKQTGWHVVTILPIVRRLKGEAYEKVK